MNQAKMLIITQPILKKSFFKFLLQIFFNICMNNIYFYYLQFEYMYNIRFCVVMPQIMYNLKMYLNNQIERNGTSVLFIDLFVRSKSKTMKNLLNPKFDLCFYACTFVFQIKFTHFYFAQYPRHKQNLLYVLLLSYVIKNLFILYTYFLPISHMLSLILIFLTLLFHLHILLSYLIFIIILYYNFYCHRLLCYTILTIGYKILLFLFFT